MILEPIMYIFNYIGEIYKKLDSFHIYFDGVSLVDIMVGFLVTSFVVSVFWKGARG